MVRASLALRLVFLALGASLVALVAAGIVISGLLRAFVVETFETNLNATMVALMANTQFDEDLGQLSVDAAVADPRFEQLFSGWYWQIADDDQVLIRSGSLWTADLGVGAAEPDGQVIRAQAIGPEGEPISILMRDFTVPGGTGRLRVSAGMPQAEIEAEIGDIVAPLVISLVLLGIGLSLAIGLQVRLGLRPLRQLQSNLQTIERGEANRLPEERYVEIAPVVTQINSLLGHSRVTIERARTHVGNLAHGLKTPLSGLHLVTRRPGMTEAHGEELTAIADTMDRLISQHLRRARSAVTIGVAGARTDAGEAIADLTPVFAGIYADKTLTIDTDIAPDAIFAGEREDLDEMLGNLIDNAAKWARARIAITGKRQPDGMMAITVGDDGPGMDPDQARLATERGRRFDESQPGSGLGLAIVADLAGLYGGALTFARAPLGGAEARLTLPGAPQ